MELSPFQNDIFRWGFFNDRVIEFSVKTSHRMDLSDNYRSLCENYIMIENSVKFYKGILYLPGKQATFPQINLKPRYDYRGHGNRRFAI